ncbi:hypothetical protein O181_091259 [Austropuccinia psidii MF-1]|uniref:Integrase catalytic domain-containing protein n=1 Tax=Austropuccinia psidii MF-1 TaxID=1389203 RepID=A0A9Q3IX74_9BASI|nr:hypothetical protein [Austropuccinia psidii MF-1]
MDWVTAQPPGGYRSYNACLVIVDRINKIPIFLTCHRDDRSMDKALLIWNRVVSWSDIFTNIISERDPKFTSAVWTNLHQLFGTKRSFPTAYHPQTDGLAERMIQTLENTGWNPRLHQDSLMEDLIEIRPTAASFEGMLDTDRKHEVRCMEDCFTYAKHKWDKSHSTPDFKVGDLVHVSTTNFNNFKGFKELKDYLSGPFVIEAPHGQSAVEVELSEQLSNNHPTFPVSLIKPDKSSDAEKCPLRNKVSQAILPVESSGSKKIMKVLKERKLRTNKVREYLFRYSDPTYEDEWLPEKDIPGATKLLRSFRNTRNNNITK